MEQDSSAAAQKHQQFVERVVENGLVWALKSEEGYATSESNEFEDVEVIPFWSEEDLAQALARDEWEAFQPASLPLSEFLEYWLVGMVNEGSIVGTNWDHELFGTEIEPIELALEISELLLQSGKQIIFEKYRDIEDYHQQVKHAAGL